MDALKKAEQEKKEAAKRQQEVRDGGGPDQEAAPAEKLNTTLEHEVPVETGDAKAARADTTMHSSTSELELEPITSRQQPLDADTTSEIGDTTSEIGDTTSEFSVAETSVEDPTLNVTLNDLALSDLDDDRIVVNTPETEKGSTTGELQIEDDAAADLDETFVGISLQQEAEDAELFQETLQGEVFVPGLGEEPDSYEETLPGVPVEQMLKDIGGEDQPTPVAAQTVFAATATVQDSSFGFKWMLAALCVVALIAGSVWYFVTVTPMNRSMPSPLVAEGVEAFVPEDIESLPPLESLKQPVVTGSIQSGIETEGIADSSGDTEMQLDESGVAALEAGKAPKRRQSLRGRPNLLPQLKSRHRPRQLSQPKSQQLNLRKNLQQRMPV